MGIDVLDRQSPKLVTHNPNHEKRVVTAVASNPTRSTVGDVPIVSVFRRTRTGDADRDGNPLIYALKGIKGYSILPYWRAEIMGLAGEILAGILDELAEFDHVLAVPSSNAFCSDVAAFVSQASGVPVLASTFIQKKTVGQMLAGFGGIPADVRKQDRQEFGAQLNRWSKLRPGSAVSMKDIARSIRPHFDPFTATAEAPDLIGRNVLIVDDLLSSGASISSVAGILRERGAMVSALCFLSGI
ncbi:phosphoribosyltransferase [Aureimonas psammosilenae]|uniref:phosphoribosyltransferase n=1 Tax=Aureimonas psammosilenae TaxID=2495496 RepID=UPI001261017C|nr:phosphoribosyltransferase [Aureimonas psammosilenae]